MRVLLIVFDCACNNCHTKSYLKNKYQEKFDIINDATEWRRNMYCIKVSFLNYNIVSIFLF